MPEDIKCRESRLSGVDLLIQKYNQKLNKKDRLNPIKSELNIFLEKDIGENYKIEYIDF